MRTALKNSMVCALAASMAVMLTACNIAKTTIGSIIRLFSRTSPGSESLLSRRNAGI